MTWKGKDTRTLHQKVKSAAPENSTSKAAPPARALSASDEVREVVLGLSVVFDVMSVNDYARPLYEPFRTQTRDSDSVSRAVPI
jgi:hypothetical protein